MEWTTDDAAGAWLAGRIDDPWRGTMHDVVPRGFPAYARIFHPASRDRPIGTSWPDAPSSDTAAWSAFQQAHPDLQIHTEPVSWAAVAAALGTTLHPTAQWGALTGTDRYGGGDNDIRDRAGWRYDDPPQGEMPADTVAALAAVLSTHTTTPDAGYVALWEGRGGLLGFMGSEPSRVFFQFGDPDDATLAHHNQMLGSATRDPFNRVFRAPSWQEGILSREISEAPRWELPGRGYVLFRGGVRELADADWVRRMPWRDLPAEAHGFEPDAQTPAIVWPDDHAWAWITEVDYDSTIVGGSEELVAALVAAPTLEALPLPAGSRLTTDADEVNT